MFGFSSWSALSAYNVNSPFSDVLHFTNKKMDTFAVLGDVLYSGGTLVFCVLLFDNWPPPPPPVL